MQYLTDTCPACDEPMEFPPDGRWHFCPACHNGRVRWVPDGLAEQLRADLAEVEEWAREGLPGAAELVRAIQARLEREERA